MKTCCNKQCKQNNPQSLEAFGKDKYTKDGLRHLCKICRREKRKIHYHLNPETQKCHNLAYIWSNPEKRAETQKRYYEKRKLNRNREALS
jgi:hypothetical protein